ncbi:hypothetical protein [Bradyrhizobium canariense]|uniref:hypothetical protein n=1 Tax=Bradyrhizobium canariense TaxID=255045 RepID=UPI001FCD90A0|nr:hypothetical protein [Bradyrhizobium canariense]
MDASGQHQHAGEFAARVRQVHLRVERPARTLERKAFRFGFPATGFDFGRSHRRVHAAVAQDPAKADRDIEIGLAPAMDDDGKLAPGLPVEDREQPLVGIPLNGSLGGDPFRAALSARIGRTACDVKDHGVGR